MATILVVDDLSANREVLVTLLRYKGHRLLEAANGRDALAAARAERPDLVITDVLMPVMDGYELVRQLRLDPLTNRIPIVFYTAHYSEREARNLALSSGVAYVLTKPVEPEEVFRAVDTALASDRTPESTPAIPFTQDFDREHLRLLTDKLSQTDESLRAANTRLRALINIGLELAAERDAGKLLQSVCLSARDLFAASYVTLGILDRNSRTLTHLVTCGVDGGTWATIGGTIAGTLAAIVTERRTMRGENPGGDPSRLQLPAGHPAVHAYLIAPIASPSHVYGWISLVGNEGQHFSEDDEQLVIALSGQVGRIYENGYFYRVARQERDHAQNYLDTAEVILLALDLSGRITLINRKGCDLLEYSEDELVGRDWIETCLPMRVRAAQRTKFERLVGGDLSIVETPILSKSGVEHMIEWRNTLLRDDAGRIVGTLSSGADVTERKRAEAALQESEARLAFALQRSHIGGWELDLRDQTAHRTLEHDRIFGYEHLLPEWTYQMFLEHVLPEDRAEVDRRFQQALANQTDWEFECRIRRVDGQVRWIWAAGGHQREDAGPAHRIAGIVMDITARKSAEEQLRTAEERMRFALESADVGIWDMDYTTGVLRWSERVEAHYGLQPGTFSGAFDEFVALVHPDDRASLLDTVGKAMKVGSDFSVENRAVLPDGSVRWLTGAGRILLDSKGQPLRGVGISLDVTERRMLEQQYHQSQKMEAVGRLAGGVAHDFNNLLTAILGYCELLLADRDSTDPAHADITQIQKAGARAAGLTRQLLAFSRKQIIEATVLNVNAVVADMRPMLERLIGEDVKVALNLTSHPAPVLADRGQMEQIVMNLAVNARDAMPKGGVLTIETANVELDEEYAKGHLSAKPGSYVALTITDTGTGMTEQVLSRLFEPFFTTKDPGKGTGLGLATVHGIVARYGGTVGVYSEIGRGTSFKVYFPRADATAMAVETSSETNIRHYGTETVLVAEDSEGLRDLTKRFLEQMGYSVLLAGNAEEALRMFEQHVSIDVLLTDVVMPGASGPELTEQLVRRRPSLKVIYMSGYTEDAITQHGVLKPGIAFINKPFTAETLGRKIRETLDR